MYISIVYFLIMIVSLGGVMLFYIEHIKDSEEKNISLIFKSVGFIIFFLLFAFCLFAFGYNIGLDDAGYNNGNVITNYFKDNHRF